MGSDQGPLPAGVHRTVVLKKSSGLAMAGLPGGVSGPALLLARLSISHGGVPWVLEKLNPVPGLVFLSCGRTVH